MNERINYPFPTNIADRIVVNARGEQTNRFVESQSLEFDQSYALNLRLRAHYLNARQPFVAEREARAKGIPCANLTYHHIGHAVDQTGYDAISILNHLHQVRSPLLDSLTLAGKVAIIIACDNHDREYAQSDKSPDNYAKRKPFHVAGSRLRGIQAVREVGLPDFMDTEWVSNLVDLGILSTKFPFEEGDQQELDGILNKLSGHRRDEADLVWKIVRFADLGGQMARVDYLRTIWDLEYEENCINANQGTSLVGDDSSKMKNLLKFFGFVQEVYLKDIGLEIFGTEHHPYADRWREHMEMAKRLSTPVSLLNENRPDS